MRRSYPNSLTRLVASLGLLIPIAATSAAEDRRPHLDPPSTQAVGHGYRAMGGDDEAPRALVLWRWNGFRFLRIASTFSTQDGRFDFGEQTLPASEVYFHVSADGEEPDQNRLVLIAVPLRAPVIVSGGLESGELVLAPGDRGGELRFFDADSGRLLLRKAIGVHDRMRIHLDFDRDLPRPWPDALSILQVLDDGRRSESQYWRLE